MTFTSLPLMTRALFDKDIIIPKRIECSHNSHDQPSTLRRLIPLAYTIGRNNLIFTRNNFFFWALNGIFHAFLIFFIPLYSSKEGTMNTKGDNYDY